MTALVPTCNSSERTRVVVAARWDIGVGMRLAIPFVLRNPREADVLTELAAIASRDDDARTLFRTTVADLIAREL